jgi:hypothetical protein
MILGLGGGAITLRSIIFSLTNQAEQLANFVFIAVTKHLIQKNVVLLNVALRNVVLI